MTTSDRPVNVSIDPFWPTTPADRLTKLLDQYRSWLRHPEPGAPPRWYCHSIVVAIEGHLRGRRAGQ